MRHNGETVMPKRLEVVHMYLVVSMLMAAMYKVSSSITPKKKIDDGRLDGGQATIR